MTLAIEGGRPVRSKPDRDRVMLLGARQYGHDEAEAVDKVLASQTLYRYHGDGVDAFERELGQWLGGGTGVLCVNSGSSALLLALASLDLTPGAEVIVPSWGFVSCATAVAAVGLKPVFAPVDRNLGLDVSRLQHYIRPSTEAILAVHPYGQLCDIDAIRIIAGANSLKLVEDVSQCLGGDSLGVKAGLFGDVSTYSMQHFKLLSTGEGGAVASNSQNILDRARFMHDAAAVWTMPEVADRVTKVAFPPMNLRMSEIEAALGRTQLSKCEEWIARLRNMHFAASSVLIETKAVTARPIPVGTRGIDSLCLFYADDPNRAAWIVDALKAEGISAGRLLQDDFPNRHWAGDWRRSLAACGVDVPGEVTRISADFLKCGVVLPLGLAWSDRDLEETVQGLSSVLDALRTP